jgi:serine/threonine protein kinase
MRGPPGCSQRDVILPLPLRGLCLFHAGTQPHEIPHDCPPALASLLRRCLDKEPAKRPGFAAILHELQAMLATLARAAPAAAPATPPLSVSHPSSSDLASLGQQLSPFAQPTDAQAAGPACTDQLLNAIPERTAGAA